MSSRTSFYCVILLSFLSSSSLASSKFTFPSTLIGSKLISKPTKVSYEIKYFTQIIDHFDYQPQCDETFQQRYLIDDRNWGGAKNKFPIFIYTGNEGDIEWFAANTGFMFDNAPYFRALLVFIEHRYYGNSIPFGGNKAIAYANASTFGYLSTTQALADFATLITDLKRNLTAEESPVVVFGGSYGGMLAAWFRLKYPHVAIGALASSAPILQFDDIVSPYTFSNIITEDFRGESENCYNVLKSAWKILDNVRNNKNQLQKLANSFMICKGVPLKNLPNSIKNWIQYALIYVAMTDYPTSSDFLISLPPHPIKKMCEAIDNPKTGSDVFAKLFGAMNIYYNNTGACKCLDPNDYGTNSALGGDAWDWQSCTELILPNGANNDESIFPKSVYNYTSDVEYCTQRYSITPRPHWITTEFGGHDIRRVLKRFGSNIIFFNGLRDPWSGGGVLKSLSKSLIAIVAPQGAHHVDLRFSTKEDPDWLQKLRKKEIDIISGWLQQYYNDSVY